MVDQLLRLFLGEEAACEITLNVDVEEGRDASDAHRCAVLRLDRREVAEIEPLHCLTCILRRLRDVEAVARRHLLHALQRTNLLRDLLALTDHIVAHDAVTIVQEILLLERDEVIDAVERDAAVVAHDAPAPIGVGQSRDDVAAACRADLVRIRVKNCLIVRLMVLCKDLVKLRADLVAVVLKSLLRHADAAVRHKCLLQRFVCLEADHLFKVFMCGIDIARAVCRQP